MLMLEGEEMRDAIKMAREAGMLVNTSRDSMEHLKRFEALVRADEREACAKLCDELAGILVCHNDRDGADICISLRDTIRARGETK
jgi:DNA-directed RNA polymerase subunit F